MDRLVAALGVLIGGAGTIFSLLVAFGAHVTPDQWTAISSVASLALVVLAAWFHPNVAARRAGGRT